MNQAIELSKARSWSHPAACHLIARWQRSALVLPDSSSTCARRAQNRSLACEWPLLLVC